MYVSIFAYWLIQINMNYITGVWFSRFCATDLFCRLSDHPKARGRRRSYLQRGCAQHFGIEPPRAYSWIVDDPEVVQMVARADRYRKVGLWQGFPDALGIAHSCARKLRCVRQERREEHFGNSDLYSEPMNPRLRLRYLAAFLLCLATAIAAQTPPEAARAYAAAHRAELVQQFSELLSIPNVAADPVNLKRNADLLAAELRKRGIDSRLLSLPGAPSVVFGQI